MPGYNPDNDEGDISVGLIDLVLGFAVVMIAVPGLIWWIGTFMEVFSPTVTGGNR